jgi:hypothetical protein
MQDLLDHKHVTSSDLGQPTAIRPGIGIRRSADLSKEQGSEPFPGEVFELVVAL